ncbi:MAG: hypothetical protein ACC661_01265, partial [Verrucomicrobiales bacterium]
MPGSTGLQGRVFALLLLVLLVLPGGACLSSLEAQTEPIRVTIEKNNGDSTVGFLLKASERAILWKYTPESPSSNTTALAEIKEIEFDQPEDWPVAVAAYNRADFDEAQQAFGAIADRYVEIVLLKGNPSAEARYFQVECLRQLGKFDGIGPLLDEATVAALKGALPQLRLEQLELNGAWAAAAAEKWEIVDQLVAGYSLPAETHRVPEMKPMAPSITVQLTYLRGLSTRAKDKPAAALTDFYRTFTLGFGND